MSKVIKLKKGLDIKLNGEAEKVVQPAGRITSCALKPTDFRAMTPKLAVKVGDEVKAGDVLTSSMRTPKPIIKQWCDPLMTFHKHCSCYSLLTLR